LGVVGWFLCSGDLGVKVARAALEQIVVAWLYSSWSAVKTGSLELLLRATSLA
jgi:hypothetical protein